MNTRDMLGTALKQILYLYIKLILTIIKTGGDPNSYLTAKLVLLEEWWSLLSNLDFSSGNSKF